MSAAVAALVEKGFRRRPPFVSAYDITLSFTVASMLDRVCGNIHVAGY